MLLRVIFRKLGLLKPEPSKWDLREHIRANIAAYEEQLKQKTPEPSTGPMIILHKLNNKEITVNTGHVQTIEGIGENALIVFTTGNRIVVRESAQLINKLIEEAQIKRTKEENNI